MVSIRPGNFKNLASNETYPRILASYNTSNEIYKVCTLSLKGPRGDGVVERFWIIWRILPGGWDEYKNNTQISSWKDYNDGQNTRYSQAEAPGQISYDKDGIPNTWGIESKEVP